MDMKEKVLNAYFQKVHTLGYLCPDWTPEGAEDVDPEQFENPDWQYYIYDERNDSTISITDFVATELQSYLRTHISAYLSAVSLVIPPLEGDIKLEEFTSELDAAVAECVATHALKNSGYCRQLASWLAKVDLSAEKLCITEDATTVEIISKVMDCFITICDEYMKFAPGPWRESTFLEALRGARRALITPAISSTTASTDIPAVAGLIPSVELPVSPDKNISDATEAEVSLSVSEGDLDVDSLSSIAGGESVVSGLSAAQQPRRNRKSRRGVHQSDSGEAMPAQLLPRGNMHTLNKLKSEIAMLQDALYAAEATDKTLLQGRLREYRLDMDKLRERNMELSARVSELDSKLFQALLQPHRRSVEEALARASSLSSSSSASSGGIDGVTRRSEEKVGDGGDSGQKIGSRSNMSTKMVDLSHNGVNGRAGGHLETEPLSVDISDDEVYGDTTDPIESNSHSSSAVCGTGSAPNAHGGVKTSVPSDATTSTASSDNTSDVAGQDEHVTAGGPEEAVSSKGSMGGGKKGSVRRITTRDIYHTKKMKQIRQSTNASVIDISCSGDGSSTTRDKDYQLAKKESSELRDVCTNLQQIVDAYEVQFQKMQDEMRYLRLVARKTHVTPHSLSYAHKAVLGQGGGKDYAGSGGAVGTAPISGQSVVRKKLTAVSPLAQGGDVISSPGAASKGQVQQSQQQQKEIDRKIIKQLSDEIEKLNSTLGDKNAYIIHLESKSTSVSASDSSATTLAGSSEGDNGTKQTERERIQPISRISKAQQRSQKSDRRLEIFYAFMLGGLVMVMLSAVVSWIQSRVV